MTPPSPPEDGLPPRERRLALAAIMVSVALSTLDIAIVNTALPTIGRDLGTDPATSIWLLNAYQLVVVAALLPLAALSEIVGPRRINLAGVALFGLTSLASGLAWSFPSLLAARAIQALGSAAISSVNIALVRAVFPARMLGRGVGLNALVVSVAYSAGPTVASAILAVASWHWLFLTAIPACAVSLLLGARYLPDAPPASRRFDTASATLCAGFFGLLLLGLGEAAHHAPPWRIALEIAASALCLLLLRHREAGTATPILAIDLFRRRTFALSAATSMCSFATQGLALVALPFLFLSLGYSQVDIGVLLTPWPVVVALMATIAGPLSDRYPAGALAGIGLMVLAAGMATLALLPPTPGRLDIAWRLVLCGAGFGMCQSPNMRALMGAAPPARSGSASGILAAARLTGQTLGAALVALCLTMAATRGPVLALWSGVGTAALAATMSFLRIAPDARN